MKTDSYENASNDFTRFIGQIVLLRKRIASRHINVLIYLRLNSFNGMLVIWNKSFYASYIQKNKNIINLSNRQTDREKFNYLRTTNLLHPGRYARLDLHPYTFTHFRYGLPFRRLSVAPHHCTSGGLAVLQWVVVLYL